MTSLHSVVPSSQLGAVAPKASLNDWFSLSGAASANGAAFANLLAGLTSGTNLPTGASQDLLSQLTNLVQNGTPLSSIIDRIAQSVGNAVQQKLAGKLPQSDLDRIRSSITTSIANALAPPGNAPPGTADQQVSALATRLQRLIESLARDSAGTGQQNDIAGNILDAKSAKDIPAQTLGKETATTLDVSSLVSSLLSGAVAALQQAAPSTSQSSTSPTTTANADASLSQSDSALPQQAITMDTAPDLLARMLVRAAGVDAKINGNAAATGSGGTSSNSGQSPSALVARFQAALANIVSNASQASSNGSFTRGQTGQSFDQQFSSQPSSSTHDTSVSNSLAAPGGFLVNGPLQNAAQSASAVSYSGIDANSVIEQLVKSMSMRTNAQGTSEIRLHLQPENLGDVTMKLTVTGSQISANVVAANADVRNALMSNHQQLARSLADAGLTLSGFSVDVSGGNAGRDQQHNDRAAGFGRRYTIHELPGAPTSETTDIASLGPPLLSGSSLALFNYLA